MSNVVKILTVGSAVGSIGDLFSKIRAIDAKHGKFDLALCIGDFFGLSESEELSDDDQVSQLLDGKLEVPLECYIMQGDRPLPEKVVSKFEKTSGELCKRVFLMSKSGVITTVHGLRIGCLAGTYDRDVYYNSDAAPGFMSPYFTAQTIDRLLSNTATQKNYTSLASIQSTSTSSQYIDILITNVWPHSITQHSSVTFMDPKLSSIGVPPLDNVVRLTKPRYHFAAGGGHPPQFWEREPFIWDDEENRVSRFVSLGTFGGEPTTGKKQRWFYAFSIPSGSTPVTRPVNASKNPFAEIGAVPTKRTLEASEGENFIFGNFRQPEKRSRIVEGDTTIPPPGYKCRKCESTGHFAKDCPDRTLPPDGYICKLCKKPDHFVRDCPTRDAVGDTGGRKPKPGYICRACGSEGHFLDDCLVARQRPTQSERGNRKRGITKEIAPHECWFCLSNPNLAKHLIVSIGSECYVTLPKGQIIPTESASDHNVNVPGGGHVLIVPITHYPTYSTIPDDLALPILEETDKYKVALKSIFSKYRSTPVFFEVGRLSAKGGHAHVQAVPIPFKLQDQIEEAFLSQGRIQGIEFEADVEKALKLCHGGRASYFKIDLPDGRKMVHLMRDSIPFSIQFGRQVLVTLLDTPDRVDWRACMLPEDEERADALAFKKVFETFAP